ncbi:MAG TPA: hypothetical protein DEP82_06130 [Arthrobacter bacterium]|nr:hypothetical protein [Arthrobacter sp.]HCB57504.1 hypothetical protein [Arthrobacter sp.]HCC38612.1 hypothetical protein [Arthrobacter sp.]
MLETICQFQFDLTHEARDLVGRKYEVFTGLQEPLASNLRWLSGYGQDRFASPARGDTGHYGGTLPRDVAGGRSVCSTSSTACWS